MRLRNVAPAALLLVGAVVAASVVASGGRASKLRLQVTPAESWQGLVGGVRSPVALGQRMIVVMRAPSLAQRVQQAGGIASDERIESSAAPAAAARRGVEVTLAG